MSGFGAENNYDREKQQLIKAIKAHDTERVDKIRKRLSTVMGKEKAGKFFGELLNSVFLKAEKDD